MLETSTAPKSAVEKGSSYLLSPGYDRLEQLLIKNQGLCDYAAAHRLSWDERSSQEA